MRAVIDTDVIAAVLLAQPERHEEAARLLKLCDEMLAPSHLKAELGNVIWKTVVFGDLAERQVPELLALTDALPVTFVDVGALWHGAVAAAIAARHPVYDTLFVELAVRERVPMASYDQGLRKKFPEIVATPASLIERARG